MIMPAAQTAIAGLVAGIFVVTTAHAQSVADIFTKLDLIGTWSVDCSRPPSRENPHYAVQRPQAPGPVLRDTVTGQPGGNSTTIDVAHELGPHQLLVSLLEPSDPPRRAKAIWLIEPGRVRVWFMVASDGRASVSDGRLTANNRESPWINKCRS
jgi:hypothetical protein